MSIINNIALERFDLLPKAIQDAIAHSGWSEKVRLICKKNQLTFDVGTIVENSTLMVMVGVLSADELLNEITEEGVSEEVAKNVIREIENQIFLPIKNELVETFNKFENEIEEEQEDNSLDVLAGKTLDEESHLESEREQILKEIEDMDSSIGQTNKETVEKTENINKHEQKFETPADINQVQEKTISTEPQPENQPPTQPNITPETSSLEKKLTETISTKPQVVKIDPYREPIE